MKSNAVMLPHSNFAFHEAVVSADHPEVAADIHLDWREEQLVAIMIYTVLQPARNYIKKPIIATSWSRNIRLNSLIPGSTDSDHLRTMAVDFYVEAEDGSVDRIATEHVFNWIKFNLPHATGQLILYRKHNGRARFIHASLPSVRYHGQIKEKIGG